MADSEDKITIDTSYQYYGTGQVSNAAITFACLFSALTEIYAKASEIGWETKALDPLAEWLRSANKAANKHTP